MNFARLLPAALLVSSAAIYAPGSLAAQARTLPSIATSIEGNSTHAYPLSFSRARLQALYERSLVGSVRVLRSIAFRPDGGGTSNSFAATTLQARLTLHQVPVNAAALSTQWQSNLGTSRGSTVFQGRLALPAFATRYPLPNPFSIRVPFTTPFIVQVSGGNLLLDWINSASSSTFSHYNIDAIAYPTSPGSLVTRVFRNVACKNRRGDSLSIGMTRSTGVLGQSITVTQRSQVGGNGKLDVRLLLMGSNNRSFGALQLPLPLGPSHPSCALAIDPLFVLPDAPIQLPNDARLAQTQLFFQGFAADSGTGDFVLSADAWTIRILENLPRGQGYQSVYRSSYTTQATGFKSRFFYAPVLRLNG